MKARLSIKVYFGLKFVNDNYANPYWLLNGHHTLDKNFSEWWVCWKYKSLFEEKGGAVAYFTFENLFVKRFFITT